jgi:hypothetical protein
MTSNELSDFITRMAIENDKMMQQMKESSQHMEQLRNIVNETSQQMKETDRQMKETDRRMGKTDKKLDRLGEILGGVSNNQGAVTEEFFFNSLSKDIHLGLIYFDDITMSSHKRRGNIEEEYDLLLTNGDAIGIIEVKYKLHENDLAKLERKLSNFKLLYPMYENYTLYGAMASFHVNNDAKKAVLEGGYFLLQRQGDLIQTDSGNIKTF